MNPRLKILKQIVEDEKIKKLAQQTEIPGEIDQETADQLADQIFDQLFDDLVKEDI